jgi:predicted MPP superfamily phosphohydrolase
MIFTFGPFALYLLLLFRLIICSSLSARGKTLGGIVLLPLALPFALNRFILGSGAAPEMPSFLLQLQGWCFFTLLLLLILLLLYDLARLGGKLAGIISRNRIFSTKPFYPGRRKAIFAAVAALSAASGLKYAVETPDVHKMEVPIARLPRGLDGLSLVQVSDLHASALLSEERIRAVVERINAVKADLVLFTGDMVDGVPAKRLPGLSSLREINAGYGVYACVGNHEYYSGYPAWIKVFPRLGMKLLLNSHALLNINGCQLVLAGLTDMVAANYALERPDLGKALAGAPEGAVRILLDHRPGNAPKNARIALGLHQPLDLQLSGHTHGGQITGMNYIVRRMNQGFVYGWYTVNDTPLYVSSGAGLWSGFPIRLGVPSEIAHIVLRTV